MLLLSVLFESNFPSFGIRWEYDISYSWVGLGGNFRLPKPEPHYDARFILPRLTV